MLAVSWGSDGESLPLVGLLTVGSNALVHLWDLAAIESNWCQYWVLPSVNYPMGSKCILAHPVGSKCNLSGSSRKVNNQGRNRV